MINHALVLLVLTGLAASAVIPAASDAAVAADSIKDAAPQKSEQLQLVQVVIRHGDRAGSNAFATEESAAVYFRGLGELSDEGIDNAHKQGTDFKMRYVDEYNLIDERFIPSEVHVRASSVSRVLMSAGSFSNALTRRTLAGSPVVAPIYTTDFDDDPLLAPKLDCLDGWDDIMEVLNLTSSVNVAAKLLGKMGEMKWPESCKDVPSEMVDAIIAELPNEAIKLSAEYAECADKAAKEYMYNYLALLGGSGDHYNEVRLKRTVGLLTNELLDNMNQKADCGMNDTCANQTEKFRVYYSHDINVLALSHVFKSINAFNGITPAFSAALVFELWRAEDGNHFVKIYLKNGHLADFAYTGLSESESRLEAVNEMAKRYAIKEPIPCLRSSDLQDSEVFF